ncbi:unnamed protein product, partial [Ixodes pacificus]
MLLHYAGEDVNDIFESLCDTTVAAAPSTSSSPSTTTASTSAVAANEFERAIEALTLHFQPRCNVEHERFLFRQERQLENESVATYHTRLRDIARRCGFCDIDGEIKSQIIQTCTSSSLRRKALSKPTMTPAQLLNYAHPSELADLHAKGIEKDLVSSSLALYAKDTAPRAKSHKQKSFHPTRTMFVAIVVDPTHTRLPNAAQLEDQPHHPATPSDQGYVRLSWDCTSHHRLWLYGGHHGTVNICSVIPVANLEPIRMPHLCVWLKTTITFIGKFRVKLQHRAAMCNTAVHVI